MEQQKIPFGCYITSGLFLAVGSFVFLFSLALSGSLTGDPAGRQYGGGDCPSTPTLTDKKGFTHTIPATSGRGSTFGGPADTGVKPDEYGWVAGHSTEVPLRQMTGYYLAMRWPYRNEEDTGPGSDQNNPSFWWKVKVVVRNPASKKSVVVEAVDWGPNITTGRVIDLSPQAMEAIGGKTDDIFQIGFAANQEISLGPCAELLAGGCSGRVVEIAEEAVGKSTSRENSEYYFSDSRRACAFVASTILKKAGALNKTYYSVDDFWNNLGGEIIIPKGGRLDLSKLKPADIVFFGYPTDLKHVGIYVGNDYFVNTSSSKEEVDKDRLSQYKSWPFAGAKRICQD